MMLARLARPPLAPIGLLAMLLLLGACRDSPPDTALAPSDSLPFSRATADAVAMAPAEAEAEAERIRATIDAEPAAGLALHLWATEALLEDPIAIDIDDSGDLFVTASSRSGGLLDIRGHPTWRHDALAMNTVQDHEAFLRDELSPERSAENEWLPDFNEDGSRDWRDLRVNTERLLRLRDTDGDGRADRSDVLVEGFNTPVHDVLGGLLVHEKALYLSAAPGLYKIDENGDASTLSWGYGVHPGFFGHGMSGVTVGPDGRIYWSVGDMGLSVDTPDGVRHHYPNQGAVLRAFPDGTGFEVFAAGLRNTHEFVFDARGDLISVDNDGDHPGEMERVVYIVEGSDSGWRTYWQFGKYDDPRNNPYKVWMDEELFKPRFEDQAAYITPPVANYHSGPAGMAYNPGTALGPAWRDHFFISEYTGSPATTHVYAFRLEPEGAGFRLASEKVAVSGVLTVGVAFGPDGALYLADWIDGWESKGAGRIWKLDVESPDSSEAGLRERTRTLLADDYSTATTDELYDRLGNADLRVRRKAQFALARQGDAETLLRAARQGTAESTRIHGVWGLWQLALRDVDAAEPLVDLLDDPEAEMRAQSARVLGDVRYRPAGQALVPLLSDASDRVRFFAAQALGRLEFGAAFDGIVTMLADNEGDDTYLRHAGALALARMGDANAITGLAHHPSEAVRIAAVVALRRMKHPGAAEFLDDESARVVTEAARAINDDGGIDEAIPALAALLGSTAHANEPLLRRIISANLRAGSPASAERLAAYARRSEAPAALRAEAVSALGVWPEPSVLDRVDGKYLGPVHRDAAAARTAAASLVGPILVNAPEAVRLEAARTAERLVLEAAAPELFAALTEDVSAPVRRASLDALIALDGADHARALRVALADSGVRMRALQLVSQADLPDGEVADLLASAVEEGTVEERQSAIRSLGPLGTERAGAVLAGLMVQLESGNLDPDVHLDVLQASLVSGSEVLRQRVESYRAGRPPLSAALYGGQAERGRDLFISHDGAQCTRCHAVRSGGGNVGPDLAGVGASLTRRQLLEALVEPAARIAPGYGSVGGPSAMPSMDPILSAMEIRDLIAYLATLK